MSELLRIEDLRVSFATDAGRASAVSGVDLTVAEGEVLALVGESGSGKTVTARAVLGLLPSTATATGRVLLGGADGVPPEDVLTATPARLRALRGSHAAMVFQEPSTALNPVFTIGWQLAEGLRAHAQGTRASRRARRSTCSARSASPTRPPGSTTIRTSSPAGRSSGPSSRWRWRSAPG